MANTLEEWYASVPTVTRMYLTLTFAVTVGCALEVRRARCEMRCRDDAWHTRRRDDARRERRATRERTTDGERATRS